MVRVTKLESLKCPECSSDHVTKDKQGYLTCDDCRWIFGSDGKKYPIDKKGFPKGRDPRSEVGDYFDYDAKD